MPPSRLGCPLSLKTPNMGNTGHWRCMDRVARMVEGSARAALSPDTFVDRWDRCGGVSKYPSVNALKGVVRLTYQASALNAHVHSRYN